jgi:heavy metal sensor kinase
MTVYTGTVIAVMLAAAFFWSTYNLRAELETRNDLFLQREFIEFAEIAQRSLGGDTHGDPLEELRFAARVHEEAGLFVALHHDKQLQFLPDLPVLRTFAEILNTAELDETPQTVSPRGARSGIRVMRRMFSIPRTGTWTMDLCLRLEETETTIANFTRRLAGGGAAFLAIAGLAGFFVTRQALRPVAASIRSAQQLNPNDLSARLPRTGSGDEIDLLAATINELLERLARNHEQMIRFTADASHELRGPLAAMRAGIEVALQKPRMAGDYRESLETLGEQVQRLTDLVNKLLLLARADAGQEALDREQVDLAELMDEAVESYRPLADEKHILLTWPGSSPVGFIGDRSRLSQLVMNLLDNAVKYTQPGGQVQLALSADRSKATLEVADSGIGISPTRLPHIFERFYQVDESRSERGGGLGLSICDWVATAHGGAIQVESQPGKGTRFRVSLPIEGTAADIASNSQSPHHEHTIR